MPHVRIQHFARTFTAAEKIEARSDSLWKRPHSTQPTTTEGNR